MGTSALTEFKSGEKTLFSIYVKDGGLPIDFSKTLLKEMNKIKRKKNGIEKLFANMYKTKDIGEINVLYEKIGVEFEDYGMLKESSLPEWKNFIEKHPECDYKAKNIGNILKSIFNDPENVFNVKRDPKNGYSHIDCRNIIDVNEKTFEIEFYELHIKESLEDLTIKKLSELIKDC